MLKTQLFALLELKKIDEKAHRLSSEIAKIPVITENLQNKLAAKQEELTKAESTFVNTEKKLRQIEADLKEKISMLEKAESKLMQITNTDEMNAAQKEIENQKKEKASLEQEETETEKQLQEQKPKFAALKEEFAAFEKGIQEDFSRMDGDKKKLDTLLSEQTQKQEAAQKNLDRASLSLYQRVVAKKKTPAIVTVDNGMCIGCNMRVRPQMYNEILSMRVIHTCPSCSRILLPPTLENELSKSV